jgi:uncharacterized protein YecA (UPF0149 family)
MKSSKPLSFLYTMAALAGGTDFMSEESIVKEYKKIKNQKPHKNRGTRITPRTEPKIGRNEQCPCGSGKKYKQCCLNK